MSARTNERRTSLARRSFLLGLAGAAGSVFVAGRYPRLAAAEPAAHTPWSGWLLDASNREAVARLGNAYRAAHVEAKSAEVLIDAIDRALAMAAAGNAVTDTAGLIAGLQQRVRDEYAQDEVVRLNGWIVSVTEARLYALVSLQSAAG